VHRARNIHASPLRYEIDSMELYRIGEALDERGEEIGAIYHSHTRSDPVPSQTDINQARMGDDGPPRYPGTLYIIVGTKTGSADIRTWSIVGNDVTRVELEVGD